MKNQETAKRLELQYKMLCQLHLLANKLPSLLHISTPTQTACCILKIQNADTDIYRGTNVYKTCNKNIISLTDNNDTLNYILSVMLKCLIRLTINAS